MSPSGYFLLLMIVQGFSLCLFVVLLVWLHKNAPHSITHKYPIWIRPKSTWPFSPNWMAQIIESDKLVFERRIKAFLLFYKAILVAFCIDILLFAGLNATGL